MRASGLKVLVTGGASGIGFSIAARLAVGNEVVVAGRDERRLAEARARVPALRTMRLDVTSAADVSDAIRWLEVEFGGLNLLVNSAGLLRGYPLDDPDAVPMAEADLAVNILGSIRMTQAVLKLLAHEREAAVVLMSSALALVPAPGLAVYSATKAAIHSLARSLRPELSALGIKLFEVLPSMVDTEPVRELAVPKISPDIVADALVRGLARDRYTIMAGRTRLVSLVDRVAPSAADLLVIRATRNPSRS